ncbi:YifB family Mg chelatase-like AAA ATPase [Kineosporia babensis]|uniref:YifB family Mg chelatase-like AAA ATPase n=1 Tax=Kineosporia babensis TaxID=499548 RepID=A0A9X1NH42_9ACTN|nr:YifB family Mg chelatase-like AAA ATPase [Kineosporia babensis]MCD5313800.1 YifB family Mg chelatase-like AAA ATPase [Kineosporia babensis]
MALGRALAVAIVGMTGHVVDVEADIALGLPAFTLVGLPDASLAESRDRVRAACSNSGHPLPQRRITVNLSPAALPKAGSSFDLAVAVALLTAQSVLCSPLVQQFVHVGELGLNGRVRPVRGVLPATLAAVRGGYPDVVVPIANEAEARLVPGARVHPVRTLADLIRLHGGEPSEPRLELEQALLPGISGAGAARSSGSARPTGPGDVLLQPSSLVPAPGGPPAGPKPDLADVVGQKQARYALELAAAGGHHLLLMGPPGTGKTLLASRLPGILPDLDDESAVEVTAVHSVAGTLDAATGLIRRPPFQNPHHTCTVVSMVGGGSGLPHPGAASLAHRGILFLDEAGEFAAQVLDSLRQPLEHGDLVIHRANGSARFPARFLLVLASNPCPCGFASGRGLDCVCVPNARRRYLSRLSGPLLDRVDLQVDVLPVSRADMAADEPAESTAVVAERVLQARAVAKERLAGTPWSCNGEVPGSYLRGRLKLSSAVTQDVDHALDNGRLSIRGHDRVLKVSWTVSDLAGQERPTRDDVSRALMLRRRGQVTV